MDIVFHNPHAIWFKLNITCFFAGTKSINKYDYLFDYVYESNSKIRVLIDKSSRASLFRGPLKFIDNPVYDFYAWVILNRLRFSKFEIVTEVKKLKQTDVLFSYLYGSFTYVDLNEFRAPANFFNQLKNSEAFKVVHLTHYGYNTEFGSRNTQLAGIDLFVAESNLYTNSNFFRKHFSWYDKSVLVLPYVPQARFNSKKEFSQRLNKALSTGTLTHKMTDKNYINFFGHNILQPLRFEISSNIKDLEPFIDSLITKIKDDNMAVNPLKTGIIDLVINYIKRSFKFLLGDPYRLISLLYYYFFSSSLYSFKNENNYYKLDIVENYNNYKMFVVPEETIGLPGIGFVEGMACGCAYIGIAHPMYQDIGMIDGVHYIGYDGTLDGLIAKISYYQENENELEVIARKGNDFVKEKFNGDLVGKTLIEKLFELARLKNKTND
jgi:glycosyltransferase involved in cell wall biosynthesis